MRKNTKGFYTVEAAIFMPLVILAVLSLGYFMRVEGTWENCIHGAVDESGKAAAGAYDGKGSAGVGLRIEQRILEENPKLDQGNVSTVRHWKDGGRAKALTSYRVEATMSLHLPLGFERQFSFDAKVKYRNFVGSKSKNPPLGAERLQQEEKEDPVWVFPHSGEKYHGESCTYVKASVSQMVLSSSLKKKYRPCGLCDSGNIPAGSIVFCFQGEDTAYHRGSCKSVKRHTIIMDRSEATKKGYRPCSKCGGG
ncbi:MAG: hypothetical protein Q4C25_01920 [Bacillota bacterium]|nr:hypothetical protein [Bacillota bacterium]